jgi:hypothetical protein
MGNIFQGGGKYMENVDRDGRKYFVKYFGRSRNTMSNIFLLRMGGGGNTVLLGNCLSWTV